MLSFDEYHQKYLKTHQTAEYSSEASANKKTFSRIFKNLSLISVDKDSLVLFLAPFLFSISLHLISNQINENILIKEHKKLVINYNKNYEELKPSKINETLEERFVKLDDDSNVVNWLLSIIFSE